VAFSQPESADHNKDDRAQCPMSHFHAINRVLKGIEESNEGGWHGLRFLWSVKHEPARSWESLSIVNVDSPNGADDPFERKSANVFHPDMPVGWLVRVSTIECRARFHLPVFDGGLTGPVFSPALPYSRGCDSFFIQNDRLAATTRSVSCAGL
jgi:hypothetical protein